MEKVFGFDFDKAYDYEHGFYLTSNPIRIAKLVTHYELYKLITNLPGDVVECGVFKAATFLQWATFRGMLENEFSRRIVGFDTFDRFPDATYPDDIRFRERFVNVAGEQSISREGLLAVCQHKRIDNVELVKGDITTTVPRYAEENPHFKIGLLHVDTDLYEPSRTVIQHFYPRVVRGGIVVFDDFGSVPGGTKAIDEFLTEHDVQLRKCSFSHWIPSYIVKP